MVDPLLCLVRVWTSTYGTPAGMVGGIVGQSTKPEAVEAQAGKSRGRHRCIRGARSHWGTGLY